MPAVALSPSPARFCPPESYCQMNRGIAGRWMYRNSFFSPYEKSHSSSSLRSPLRQRRSGLTFHQGDIGTIQEAVGVKIFPVIVPAFFVDYWLTGLRLGL